MKNYIRTAFFALIIAAMPAMMVGCGKKEKKQNEIQTYLASSAATVEKEYAKGMKLTKRELNEGDTVLTYHIKVEDNRFEKVTPDSLKATIANDLKNKERLTKMLKRNGIGIQYVYDTPSKVITIFFAHDEL